METQAAALSRGSLVLNQAIRSEWLPDRRSAPFCHDLMEDEPALDGVNLLRSWRAWCGEHSCYNTKFTSQGRSSVVEQLPFKPKVVGSIPTAPTNQPFFLEQLSDLSRRQKAAIRRESQGWHREIRSFGDFQMSVR